MNNLLSYLDIIVDRQKFRRAGTNTGGDFNLFDVPTSKFFKIFFYFDNGDSNGLLQDSNGLSSSGGLLAPTWLIDKQILNKEIYRINSAFSYLMLNDEVERASLLKDFVTLLSNISAESPWYFSAIEGLDAAMERKVTMERDFKFEEARPKFTIKCLPDAYDDRIGTLLDLYKSIVWSWAHKREVLPSNLRKFDMGILIFNDPTIPFHHYTHEDGSHEFAVIRGTSSYRPSYKYIEFHNCEIDYNSSKAGVAGLNNVTGTLPEYSIDIHFDDFYEHRYNEFSMSSMGDILLIDHLIYSIQNYVDTQKFGRRIGEGHSTLSLESRIDLTSKLISYYESMSDKAVVELNKNGVGTTDIEKIAAQIKVGKIGTVAEKVTEKNLSEVGTITGPKSNNLKDTVAGTITSRADELKNNLKDNLRLNDLKNISLSKSVNNVANQLAGTAMNMVEGTVKRAVIGNMYSFSLTRLADQLTSAANGNIWTLARNIHEYANDDKQRKEGGTKITGSALGDIYPTPTNGTQYINRKIGNLAQANTLVNNI